MAKPREVIYHFTCEYLAAQIWKSGYLQLTKSTLALGEPHPPVLWLTTSPTPENNGLDFDAGMPLELDKAAVRITLRKHDFMLNWLEWHKRKGRCEEERELLISTARAEESHKN